MFDLSKITIGTPQNIRIEMFSQALSDSDKNHHEIPARAPVWAWAICLEHLFYISIFTKQQWATGQRYLLCTNRDGCDQ